MKALTLQKILADHLAGDNPLPGMALHQLKAFTQLSRCRTSALGGHTQYCANGHVNGVWYNSCKQRSCPQCCGIARETWLLNLQRLILDCPHHHIIFTLPSQLNDLWRHNRRLLSDILFSSVRDTLKRFSDDKRYLDATPGMVSVLHTWGRDLPLHPHIHTVTSHGGINRQGQWVVPRKTQLFPQKPVMMVFRGKVLAALKRCLKRGEVVIPAGTRAHQVEGRLNKLGRQSWVVHFCQRYDQARGVAKYLARYIKGGAFNNGQLREHSPGMIKFTYQSHRTKRRERLILSTAQFIQRVSQHLPEPGKPGVRYGGLYASGGRKRLNQAREQLGQRPVQPRITLQWEEYLDSKGYRPVCEVCGLPLIHALPVVKKQ